MNNFKQSDIETQINTNIRLHKKRNFALETFINLYCPTYESSRQAEHDPVVIAVTDAFKSNTDKIVKLKQAWDYINAGGDFADAFKED